MSKCVLLWVKTVPSISFNLNFDVSFLVDLPVKAAPSSQWPWLFESCWRLCTGRSPWHSGAPSVERASGCFYWSLDQFCISYSTWFFFLLDWDLTSNIHPFLRKIDIDRISIILRDFRGTLTLDSSQLSRGLIVWAWSGTARRYHGIEALRSPRPFGPTVATDS